MASLPPSLRNTLSYFDRYDYPLTLDEARFWQEKPGSFLLRPQDAKGETLFSRKGKYYFLPGRSHIVSLRQQREQFSKTKWLIARRVGEQLKKFPFIIAIFVTGALAMNNCPKDDDIDLMLVTYPNTLWITRFFVNLYLWRLRRFPGQTTAPDKICPNLWLDSNRLRVTPWVASGAQGVTLSGRYLYLAHEILQAKCIFDRGNMYHKFITQNSWVKNYLPIAYKKTQRVTPFASSRAKGVSLSVFFWPLNIFFFLIQYLYMFPKMTSEKIAPGFAFFHPRSN